MLESDRASVISAQTISDISIDDRHPDEVWDCVTHSPRIHSIVVFSMNATATVDSLFGEDASEAINTDSLPRKAYVGFIEKTYGLPLDDDPYTECRIYFITQGLPSSNGVCESSMCTPLWPATEHPSGRKSIRLREPLPWDNCYLHSTSYVDVRVLSANFEHAKISGVMLFPEATRHREFRNADQARKLVLWEERKRATPLAEGNAVADGEGNISDPAPVHRSREAKSEDIEYAASSQGSREASGNLLLGIMCAEPSDFVTVDATYDLSTISSLPDPQEFFEEEKAIRKLAREFMERKAILEAEEEAGWAREMKEEQERMLAPNSQPSVDTTPEPEQKPLRKRNRFNFLRVLTDTRVRLGNVFNKHSPSISTSASSSSSLPHSEVITPKSILGRASHGRSRFRTTVQQKIRSAFGLTRRKSNVYLL
ncbi:hypothetical protein JAAARDRAFT_43177 [Jaapia argillacea MUCL 33604]|uniref:Uncharacterized protein n=1 Tax=Jaapia argillacea MUCL 33604 TaxID=933084 RepID=A0A067PEH9_9AGAM|nr:hypothetical protein JAAARDRAFT_43177 [Jaapia argillacea MUCL 33604]